jgi:hypothetical protein
MPRRSNQETARTRHLPGPAQSQPTATRHNPVLGIRPVFGHESRLNKIFNITLKQVREMIEAPKLDDQARMKEAIRIRRADKIKRHPTNFQEIGFVFSTGQLDAAIRREDLLVQADITISKSRFDLAAPRK